VGLLLMHLGNPLVWGHALPVWWFPPVGVGLVLVAWLGPWAVLLLFAEVLLAALQARLFGTPTIWGEGWPALWRTFAEAAALSIEVLAAWGCYRYLAHGSRRLGDPRSATLFLILVPALTVGVFAVGFGVTAWRLDTESSSLLRWVGLYWLSHALGILVLAPPLLATLTPWLVRQGFARPEPVAEAAAEEEPRRMTWGDVAEIGSLGFFLALLSLLQAHLSARQEVAGMQLWGLPLLVIVWASLRHGLRGGTVMAACAAGTPLLIGLLSEPVSRQPFVEFGRIPTIQPVLQVNLLAECGTALLAAAAANWIRLSEARYRQVVTRIPVVLYSARVTRRPTGGRPPQAEVVFVSPAARTLFGADPDALLGDHAGWLAHVHPDDREVVLGALAQLAWGSGPLTCEYRLALAESPARKELPRPAPAPTPADGILVLPVLSPRARQRWVRETLAPHYGAAGDLEGWDGVLNDITEQRALADDLRRTTSMFHALVASLPAGVFFVQGEAGLPVLVNVRARQLLGRREDQAAGLARLVEVYRLCRPDGTPYPTEELPVTAALRRGATVLCDDIVVYRPDGQRLPLITWAAPIDLGGPGRHDAAVWVFEDLSALRQAEAARRESESRLRAIVETMPILLIQLDGAGRMTYLNPAAQSATGYGPAELRAGAGWETIVHPDDLPRAREAVAQALGGQTARLELRYRPLDGSEKVGYALVVPRREDGRVAGVTALMVDMTRERQLEADLQRAQRLELIGRLASGIAHDFNNLLTVVLTLAELARNSLPMDHPTLDDLRRISLAGEQAANLAHQLLAFSKQRRAEPRRIDVNRVAERALELLRATLPKSIHVEPSLAQAELPVQADEMQLQQVLMNLCLNARDAMPHGGRLGVRTEAVPGDGGGAAHWVRLSVQDNGEGIPGELQGRIFDAFFSTKERGTGLGLAMVRQIVEGFGGRVEVASRPGEGARFDVWLPREPDGSPA
jgi:PAS domain S-box-containing protein